MTFSERYPGGNLKQAWPLAVSLAAHVLLVLAWPHFGARQPVPDETPRALSVLLLPKPAPAPTAVPPPEKDSAAKPQGTQGSVSELSAPRALVPTKPADTSNAVPAPVATATEPSAWDIVDKAKQDIRKGALGSFAGKKGVEWKRDSKWSRFEEALAAAHIDRSRGPVTETYTSPDGQVFYRTRSGGKVVCRKSGSTGPPAPWRSEEAIRAGAGSAATLGVANSAGTTLCPESPRD
jgi:hypothetical protein